MLKRTITGACIVALVFTVIYFSHVPAVLLTATAAICVCAIYEIYRATGVAKNKKTLFLSFAVAAVIAVIPIPHYEYILIAVFTLSIVVFAVLMRRMEQYRFENVKQSVIIAVLVVLMFRAIPSLRQSENGLYYFIFAVTVCFITDIAAYLMGKAFGVHKLAPKVSPKKTVEGALGGIVFTMLIALIGGTLLEKYVGVMFDYKMLVVYAVLASVISQFGDLSMSVIKRICGVKDYGKLFPGHGGVLDRFDSHMFAIAFTLLFCTLTGRFII